MTVVPVRSFFSLSFSVIVVVVVVVLSFFLICTTCGTFHVKKRTSRNSFVCGGWGRYRSVSRLLEDIIAITCRGEADDNQRGESVM